MRKSDAPKVFISYSWSPESNRQKVIEIGERLTADGVHIIIDIWDLKEGHDQYIFMEKMVNDDSIKLVLLMCNEAYAAKANAKKGGVGTESQIVSPEIYKKTEQTRFIPIIMERDNKGEPCVPTFVKSRIYIDLSDSENFENEYDKLLRLIFGKPEHKRPPIGNMPSHLASEDPIFTPTSNIVAKIKNALIEEKKFTNNLIHDYIDAFVDVLPEYKLELEGLTNETLIEKIDARIEETIVLRKDFESFLNAYLKYSDPDWELLHSLFERILNFMENDEASNFSSTNIGSLVLDPVRFLLYELFLSFTVIMIEKEYYSELGNILRSPFLVSTRYAQMEEVSFTEFRYWIESLDKFKNQKLGLNLISVTADTMKKRAKSEGHFLNMVDADILLHYLATFLSSEEHYDFGHWFPITACYNLRTTVLSKMKSRRHFEKIKELFGVENKEELITRINKLIEQGKADQINNINYMGIKRIDHGLRIEEIGSIS